MVLLGVGEQVPLWVVTMKMGFAFRILEGLGVRWNWRL
jgi:hypothetical protein